jgi:hypothetical protein
MFRLLPSRTLMPPRHGAPAARLAQKGEQNTSQKKVAVAHYPVVLPAGPLSMPAAKMKNCFTHTVQTPMALSFVASLSERLASKENINARPECDNHKDQRLVLHPQ